MDDFENIPEMLYSWIDDKDISYITKKYEIKYWWHAFSDIYRNCKTRDMERLARILQKRECWTDLDKYDKVKLDGRTVGSKIIHSLASVNILSIACRCCLEKESVDLIHKRLPYENIEYTVDSNNCLERFWLKYVESHEKDWEKDWKNKKTTENSEELQDGFYCALSEHQPQALEYFWRKIRLLPGKEMSTDEKQYVLLKAADQAASLYHDRPEIFKFIFRQIFPKYYCTLLEQERQNYGYYRSILALLKSFCFNEFKVLFDTLTPDQIPPAARIWLLQLRMHLLSGWYMQAAVDTFIHVWEKESFAKIRSSLLTELSENVRYQRTILVPLIEKGYTEVVWLILDKSSPEALRRYMNSDNAKSLITLLKLRNDFISLNKFTSYFNVQ